MFKSLIYNILIFSFLIFNSFLNPNYSFSINYHFLTHPSVTEYSSGLSPFDINKLYFFGNNLADGNASMKHQLGAKGANLAENCRLGLPVPAGFTISWVTLQHYLTYKEFPDNFDINIREGIHRIEKTMSESFGINRQFADPQNPLLLSIRAGAESSAPGVYPTITHIGLHRSNLLCYANHIGNIQRAYFDYLFLIKDYSTYVYNNWPMCNEIDAIFKESSFFTWYKNISKPIESIITIDECEAVLDKMENIFEQHAGRPFPEPDNQILPAIEAIIHFYRDRNSDEGKAVTVQAMVYGNINDGKSGTGVVFSRNPYNGEPEIFGNVLFNQCGDFLVTPFPKKDLDDFAGVYSPPQGINALETTMPGLYSQLIEYVHRLEKHHRSIRDIEFTFEQGTLFILQDRDNEPGTTPLARARILMEMHEEGLLSEDELLGRLIERDLIWLMDYLESPVIKKEAYHKACARGIPLIPGIGIGAVVVGNEKSYPKGSIIVTQRPFEGGQDFSDFNKIISDVNGIVTRTGSSSDHAASAIRGLQHPKPYITGISMSITDSSKINDNTLKPGKLVKFINIQNNTETIVEKDEVITIDANTGYIYKGELPSSDYEDSEVVKVQKKLLFPENSRLYRIYQKASHLLTVLKKRAQMLRNQHNYPGTSL